MGAANPNYHNPTGMMPDHEALAMLQQLRQPAPGVRVGLGNPNPTQLGMINDANQQRVAMGGPSTVGPQNPGTPTPGAPAPSAVQQQLAQRQVQPNVRPPQRLGAPPPNAAAGPQQLQVLQMLRGGGTAPQSPTG